MIGLALFLALWWVLTALTGVNVGVGGFRAVRGGRYVDRAGGDQLTRGGADDVPATSPEFIELARSLEAAPWRTFVKIRIPSALPQVFVGLKPAMSLAVIGAVISEFQAGTVAGLGFVITTSSGQMDTAQAFAAIAILGVLSIVLFYALVALERALIPWARPAGRR